MGLFGRMKLPPMPGPISGYGGGTWNMDGTQATPIDMQPFIPTADFGPRPDGIDEAAAYTGPSKKGGLFGSGVKWQQVAGALGDALLAANGNQSMPYTQMQNQQRQQDNLLKRMQAQRQAELQDQMALYDYKRANPTPVVNDTINDFNWFKSLSESDRQIYQQLHPQYTTVDNGDGTKTVMPLTPGMFNQPAQQSGGGHDLPPGYSVRGGGSGGNAGGGFR